MLKFKKYDDKKIISAGLSISDQVAFDVAINWAITGQKPATFIKIGKYLPILHIEIVKEKPPTT